MKSLSVRPLILCVQVVISTFPQARKISGWCPCSSASSPTRFTNPRALRKSGNLNVFLRWCSPITFHPSTCFCREASSSPFSGGTPPRHGTQALAARSDITTIILAAACMKSPRRFPAPLRQPRSLKGESKAASNKHGCKHPNYNANRREVSMLLELSVIPLGRGRSISADIVDLVRVIDASGLDYRLSAAGTIIEGGWDQLMDVARKCHTEMRKKTERVITVVRQNSGR